MLRSYRWMWGAFFLPVLIALSMVVIKSCSVQRNREVQRMLTRRIAVAPSLPHERISPDTTADLLVAAIIQIESGGDPSCVGAAGERGLMQIMPDTWSEMTEQLFGAPLPFDRAFDPVLNERVGRFYLNHLQEVLSHYRAEWQSDERALLLAAFNGGPNRLREVGFDVNRMPRSVQNYVERSVNLHEHLLAGQAGYVRNRLTGYER